MRVSFKKCSSSYFLEHYSKAIERHRLVDVRSLLVAGQSSLVYATEVIGERQLIRNKDLPQRIGLTSITILAGIHGGGLFKPSDCGIGRCSHVHAPIVRE